MTKISIQGSEFTQHTTTQQQSQKDQKLAMFHSQQVESMTTNSTKRHSPDYT